MIPDSNRWQCVFCMRLVACTNDKLSLNVIYVTSYLAYVAPVFTLLLASVFVVSGAQFAVAADSGIEIIELEPEQDAEVILKKVEATIDEDGNSSVSINSSYPYECPSNRL